MDIFNDVYEPFTTPEFCKILNNYTKLNYIFGIPTFNGKRTFFYSLTQFKGIKQQYLISEKVKKPIKYFFIKYSLPYEQTLKQYHKHFRNQLRKSLKNKDLQVKDIVNNKLNYIDSCYSLYCENMKALNTFSFPYDFFCNLCKLSYSRLIIIQHKHKIISFGLLLGNVLFIQSSNLEGHKMCANNLLYDYIYKLYENKIIFMGTSFPNSGQYRFKINSGATPIPIKSQEFSLFLYLPTYFRNNLIIGFLLRQINNRKMLPYFLPY